MLDNWEESFICTEEKGNTIKGGIYGGWVLKFDCYKGSKFGEQGFNLEKKVMICSAYMTEKFQCGVLSSDSNFSLLVVISRRCSGICDT